MQQSKQDAFVVTVIKEPAKEGTVSDLIIGSLGVAGTLFVAALALGAVAGAVLVIWHRFFPSNRHQLPPVRPSFTNAKLPPT